MVGLGSRLTIERVRVETPYLQLRAPVLYSTLTFATTSCVILWRRTEAWLASLFNSPGDIQDSPFLTATAKFQLAPE